MGEVLQAARRERNAVMMITQDLRSPAVASD